MNAHYESVPFKKDTGSENINSANLIDLIELISVIWRNKLWVFSSVLAAIFIATFYLYYIAIPRYAAYSVVVMESRDNEVVGLDSVLGGLSNDASVVNTEVEVLRGRTLIGRVVDELNLVDDPEFNGTLQPNGPIARLKERLLGGQTAVPDVKRVRDSVVSNLLGKITITNIPKSLVFKIGVETQSAEKSAEVADSLARLYIDDQVRVKFEATEKAAEWLTGQVADLKAELESSEERIRRFQSSTSVINADTLAAMDRQIKDTRERRASIESELSMIEAQRRALANAPTPNAQSAILNDPQLAELALAIESGGAVPESAFAARLAQLDRQMSQDTMRLQSQADALAGAEQSLNADFEKQSQELMHIEQMMREAEAGKLLYEHFQTRLKEAVAQQGIQQADSRVLSDAVISGAPSAPRRTLIFAIAGTLGLLLGCALVLLRQTRASSFRTANDLEAASGRIVLGQIPQAPERNRAKVLHYLMHNPTSAMAEAVRNLRTSILLSDIDNKIKVIALTSSVPGEGKTTLTLALAQNLTMMGKKVLVIEGDIRRRTFMRYLNLPQKRENFLAVISGKVTLQEGVQSVPGLGDVLFGEKIPTNAADLFTSEAFAQMLRNARESYDHIIVDTPPVLVVPDARIIAQNVDTTIFVVRWDRTSTTQVRDGLRMFDGSNSKIAGIVLSQIDPKGMRRYGYGERYGAYAAYGSKYYTTTE